jgi:phospholipid transport system substrate-binding protein
MSPVMRVPDPRRRAVLGALLALALAPAPARALSPDDARAFVARLADELIAIVRAAGPNDARTAEFLALFRRVAALEAIGRFTMGATWRSMTDDQKSRFMTAFESYAARAYASRIGEYQGQTLDVNGAQDLGQKGVLVKSVLEQPGAQPIAVEWLVSDRTGAPRVVDIVAEGVSLSISQREEFAAMVEARGGDIDRFIADLAAGGA